MVIYICLRSNSLTAVLLIGAKEDDGTISHVEIIIIIAF
jgi:hypothetical protein